MPLGSPASFCHLDLFGLGQEEVIISGTGDIPDMFSRLTIPEEAWPWFVLDIDLGEFLVYMAGQGHQVEVPEGARFLASKALMMGWSWAPFLAHMSLVAVIDGEFGPTGPSTRMVYGHPVPQLRAPHRPAGLELLHWA